MVHNEAGTYVPASLFPARLQLMADVTLFYLLRAMYSIDDLLHVLNSDGADRLLFNVGGPPVLVMDGEEHPLEGVILTNEVIEELLNNLADSRQRRELRENGRVQFMYRFRNVTDFVVHAKIENENLSMEIH